MADETTKPWYQSLTIDASLIAGLLSILGIFGVNVAKYVTEAPNIATVINSGIVLVASVVAIIGRLRATKTIG